ncbi:MAG TPA: hypothetical protein VGP70_06385 [Actinomadura sp.]|nr:hypothetical protein [Actinomadura sp.]
MSSLDTRLDALRGSAPSLTHNARTVAALTANPGCARRAVMDAAGVDKTEVAAQVGFPSRFGQSPFALARGVAFEAQVKANGCAELLRLLREELGLSIPEVAYIPLDAVGDNSGPSMRHRRTRAELLRAAGDGDELRTLFDHPMLTMRAGGHTVYLEPDLVAFQLGGRFHVIEIKSFAVIDGQADGEKVAAATTQAAVYILALRDLLAEAGLPAEAVSDDVILVTPKDFSNEPVATLIDARKQLGVLRRQLSRLTRIETLLDTLPPEVTFDLAPDPDGTFTRPPAELAAAVGSVDARYQPGCLSHCELSGFCRNEGRTAGSVDVLGPAVRDDLGGLESMATALALADGTRAPSADQADIASALRHAARLRAGLLGGVA